MSDPAGWYPYVQACNKTWQPVLPQAVPAPQGTPR